ncbi:PLP-dependent transferase [Sodiomyces alkalinus F11]|uniref:PLP-dependent transferase n=1 Tax=Sodiomyces alkalinus (strain CBS 110278 / VKM F-3762 / F11) TaxID=1314773 RepID=A0A3N2PNI1_SODAK|nr:PLP-dependent transferase [Sodiomyces alkalinus F11]ROT36091.1 PLP-dependent transferase [Sodiomyces alkalinus F11]
MGSSEQSNDGLVQFGSALKKEFPFDPEFRNLNHGSFGAAPRAVHAKVQEYRARADAVQDIFLRYEYPRKLDDARAAVAQLVNAPLDTVVFVPNATTAVNVVLRNLVWDADGRDEILCFSVIYGACGKTVDYAVDSARGLVSSRSVDLAYPLEDDDIVQAFRDAVATSRAEGKRPRLAIYDVVVSQPGVRFPFEELTRACRELGVLSLIDGAQGIGMLPLDLAALDPDFFVSNCHKWLHVPRACALFHVPVRNQHLLTSTLPTSHGYRSQGAARANPLPQDGAKPAFVSNFEFVGTLDNAAYLAVKDALEWRENVLGGERRIIEYLWTLAKEGGSKVADILGTQVLDNKKGTLTNNAMVNIFLPIKTSPDAVAPSSGSDGYVVLPSQDAAQAVTWMLSKLMDEYKTFIPICCHAGKWYVRLSAQVYLDTEDFAWAGRVLKELCERVGKHEYKDV